MKKSLKRVQCVLTSPIRGKGGIGDVVNIKRGYAKYLERFNKATRATKEVLENIEAKKIEWKSVESTKEKQALEIVNKLKAFPKITMFKRVSHAETLYSAVKPDEIITFFEEKGIKLKKEQIKIDRIIKTLGEHEVVLNVYGEYVHNLIVEICKEGA